MYWLQQIVNDSNFSCDIVHFVNVFYIWMVYLYITYRRLFNCWWFLCNYWFSILVYSTVDVFNVFHQSRKLIHTTNPNTLFVHNSVLLGALSGHQSTLHSTGHTPHSIHYISHSSLHTVRIPTHTPHSPLHTLPRRDAQFAAFVNRTRE